MRNFKAEIYNSMKMNSQRFFSSNLSSPKVQFMHIITEKAYRRGRLDNHIILPKNLHKKSEFNVNVLQHDDNEKNIMEYQAKEVLSCMENILKLAEEKRGLYEQENSLPHINGNTIVHVATPEFFFYPSFGVFSEDQVKKIIVTSLKNLLKTLPSWLHFHFGTLPVQLVSKEYTNKPYLINMAIYGNGGASPTVEYYAKKYPHKTTNFTSAKSPFFQTSIQAVGDPYHIDNFENFDLGFPRCVYSETPSGGKFIKSFDICLDHGKGVALDEFLNKINSSDVLGFYSLVSNSVDLNVDKTIFKIVSQTDPTSNQVFAGINKKTSWMGSVFNFVDEQVFETTATSNTSSWAPCTLKVHKTVEMSGISEIVENIMKNSSPSSLKPK